MNRPNTRVILATAILLALTPAFGRVSTPAIAAEAEYTHAPDREDALSPRLTAVADGPDDRVLSRSRLVEATATTPDDVGELLTDGRGRLIVDVTLAEPTDAALASLEEVGAELIATDGGPVLATVAVPLDAVRDLAALPTVAYVAEVVAPYRSEYPAGAIDLPTLGPAPAAPNAAACAARVVSEGDTQLRADELRAASGSDGSGVVVGVVSDSYDNLGGAGTDIAAGELPGPGNPCGYDTPVRVQSDLDSGGSDEGRAMLQIVHDLAPGAELVVATGATGEVAMAEQIRQLGTGGADIITDDIGYLTEPMFQDGPIAQAIEENRTERGILHFAAAGNANAVIGGRNVTSYESPAFRPTACPAGVPAHQNACHDVDGTPGTDAGAGITLVDNGSIVLMLGWSEPMYGVTTDLDLYLVDTVTGLVVAASELNNAASMRAGEYLTYRNITGGTRTFDIVIGRYGNGTDPSGTPRIRTVLVRSAGLVDVEYDESADGDTVGPTVYGHSAEATAMSVAAIGYDMTSSPETFSSRGPGSLCWEQVDGTVPQPPITPCETATIDITATDGGANSFFGSQSAGAHRFFGTSAAAPHAAAVAAVLTEARPCRHVDELAEALTAGASPIGSYGTDAVGAGLVDAVASLAALADADGCTPTIAPIDDVTVFAGQPGTSVAVKIADRDHPASSLTTTATSADTSLLPDAALEIVGSGGGRTLTITAPPDTTGSVAVTVTVSDGDDRQAAATFTVSISEASVFVPSAPARYADSRDEATFDARFRDTGPRASGSTWEIDITDRGGVPQDAAAAVVNLTVVGGTGPGFATVHPCGGLPNASSLNYDLGAVEANEIVAALSPDGTICVFTLTEADVIVDVVGYVSAGSPYRPLTPQRFADSRDEATIDGRFRSTGQRRSASTWEIDIAGRGPIPDDAAAVVANVTVTGGAEPGFATVYPCGEVPAASSLNYGPGVTRPNEVVAELSERGTLCVFTLTDVDVIVDVIGYLPADPGIDSITPQRYADSRAEQTFDGTFRATGVRRGGTTWEIDVAGRGAVPEDAAVAIANVTVIGRAGPGFATVYPCGEVPTASSLNYAGGTVRANEVVAQLSSNGTLCVFTLTDADVLVDIVGSA